MNKPINTNDIDDNKSAKQLDFKYMFDKNFVACFNIRLLKMQMDDLNNIEDKLAYSEFIDKQIRAFLLLDVKPNVSQYKEDHEISYLIKTKIKSFEGTENEHYLNKFWISSGVIVPNDARFPSRWNYSRIIHSIKKLI